MLLCRQPVRRSICFSAMQFSIPGISCAIAGQEPTAAAKKGSVCTASRRTIARIRRLLALQWTTEPGLLPPRRKGVIESAFARRAFFQRDDGAPLVGIDQQNVK